MARGVFKRKEVEPEPKKNVEPEMTVTSSWGDSPATITVPSVWTNPSIGSYVESRADFIKRVATDLLMEAIKQPGMIVKSGLPKIAHERAIELADLLELKD